MGMGVLLEGGGQVRRDLSEEGTSELRPEGEGGASCTNTGPGTEGTAAAKAGSQSSLGCSRDADVLAVF